MPVTKTDGKNGGKSYHKLRVIKTNSPIQETVIGDGTEYCDNIKNIHSFGLGFEGCKNKQLQNRVRA